MNWKPPALDPDRELRELLPEDGWRQAIREICRRHGIPAADLVPFATGSDIVWSAGDQVVKLTDPEWTWQIEAEARWLEHVAGRLSVLTPTLQGTGQLGGWPYVVMERIPGVAIGSVWSRSDSAERTRLAADLGRLTRELHELSLDDGMDDGIDDWDEFWARCRANVARRPVRQGEPAELHAAIGPYLQSIGELPSSPRVLLHTELLDQHVFVEPRGGRFELSGLIDFADARVGPAAYDFPAPVEFLFKGEEGLLRTYLLAYGLPEEQLTPAYSRELLAWALSHRYGNLGRMLRALEPERPETLEELAQRLYGVA